TSSCAPCASAACAAHVTARPATSEPSKPTTIGPALFISTPLWVAWLHHARNRPCRLGPKVPRDRLDTVSNNSDQAYVAPRLTQFAAGGGCACKIPAGLLERLVSGLPVGGGPEPAARVLVGTEHGDDGGVVQVRDDLAVISTAD